MTQSLISEVWILIKETLGLYKAIALIVSYWYMGAMLFAYLERQDGVSVARSAKLQKTAARHALLMAAKTLPKSDIDKWTSTMQMIINQYDNAIEEYKNTLSHDHFNDWDFEESAYFVFTVLTTIGYGHLVPKTIYGRISTVIYAFFGIPICLAVLNEFGQLATRYFKVFRSLVYKSKIDNQFNVNIFTASLILISYTAIGVVMFRVVENWPTLHTIYFIFVSYSTIGFGDVLPKNSNFFLFSCAYSFFGLAIYSMVINVFMTFFQNILHAPKPKMDFRVKFD